MKVKRVSEKRGGKRAKISAKSRTKTRSRKVSVTRRGRKQLENTSKLDGSSICQRLTHLLTRTSVVIYASKATGDYAATFVSDNVQRVTGYKYSSFVNRPHFWIDHIHPDDRERVLNEVVRVFESDYYEYDYRFKHKDGRYIWMHDEMRLIRDSHGQPLEIVGYWVDITKRKQMEKEIEERAERIQGFMESASEGFAMLDSDFNVIYVNNFLLDKFGLKRAQVIGLNYFDISDIAYESGRYEQYLEILETGRPRLYDDLVLPPHYGSRHVSAFVFKVGDCLGLIVKDVTEELKRQDELKESEARFRSLFDSTVAGVFFHDTDGVIVSANKQACDIFDMSASELIGTKHEDICSNVVDMDGNKLKGEDHPVTRTLRTGQPIRNMIVGMPADEPRGMHWLLVNSDPIIDDETGKVDEVVCSFIDITDQKYVEDELAESEERYRQIFENCPIGIGISDSEGRVVTANNAMQLITGYSLAEFKKINLADTFENSSAREDLRKILSKKEHVSDYHVRLLRKDGTSYDAVLTISLMEIGGKVYFHTMCHVVTP
ncbi:MAG: PAS domain S-box protein [candidate division WOR-3 bacterium]|nr:MAG: PAS domain S-box protein [candidate division WOR-3 bacterium]